MRQGFKAVGATALIAVGVGVLSYFTVPSFKEMVDEFANKFRSDMSQREDQLIEALSSTAEEIDAAHETWSTRSDRKGRHAADDYIDDDDLIFE